MNFLTNILYWISSGLLVPVIIFLLILFVRSLLILGGFFSLYVGRIKFSNDIKEVLKNLKENSMFNIINYRNLKHNPLFMKTLNELNNSGWHEIHGEKSISDFRNQVLKNSEISRFLMRLGPMLGLMGTLIPLGPALVGLSTGDISSMALNMQVAFATTVIGIFIGVIGYVTHQIKQRWFNEDMNNLEYIFETARQNAQQESDSGNMQAVHNL